MMGKGNTEKNKKGHRIWSQLIMVVCLAVIVVSGYMLYVQLTEYHAGEEA